MSTRARLARLERLERLKLASRPDHSCPDFPIAPELARAIVKDYDHLSRRLWDRRVLAISPLFARCIERPDPAAEEEVAARLAEHLRGINCPPNYWAKQADTDRRLTGYMEPSVSGEELVHARARNIVFDGSPDGAAWRRMMDLFHRKRTRAQQAELDQLHERYPGMPLKEHCPILVDKLRERAADGSTAPVEDFYSAENALWKRVDQYR